MLLKTHFEIPWRFDQGLTIELPEIYNSDLFLVSDLLATPLDPTIGGIL
jgi:hypothetical protein